MSLSETMNSDELDEFVKSHMAFIIKTVSRYTGRYVSVENDDEFSIALEAFCEAVKRYDEQKGQFLSYARLVIESRLSSYFKKTNKQIMPISIDSLKEQGFEFSNQEKCCDNELQQEILEYKNALRYFHITLDQLVDEAPKHHDTKQTAFQIAKKTSDNNDLVEEIYDKKRLLIKKVAQFTCVSEKIVKRSKTFILSIIVIFVKNFPQLLRWIKETRCSHVS